MGFFKRKMECVANPPYQKVFSQRKRNRFFQNVVSYQDQIRYLAANVNQKQAFVDINDVFQGAERDKGKTLETDRRFPEAVRNAFFQLFPDCFDSKTYVKSDFKIMRLSSERTAYGIAVKPISHNFPFYDFGYLPLLFE